MARPKVLVIGCGFGGLEAVRALSKADVEITLIDRTNHHLFQPLLYQVATASMSAPSVSAPIRHMLRAEMRLGNLTVLQAEAQGIDATEKVVRLENGERIAYDHLIVAAGNTHSYFGHDEWAPFAPGLKTLADAFAIRARVIGAFERAERCATELEREPWMTFVVIGGGPTGVEMAGTMTEIAHHTLPQEFRRIDSKQTRVLLLEGSNRVLSSFVPTLSEHARQQLKRLEVDVRTGCKVTGIDATGVTYETAGADGKPRVQHLPSRTVIWAAGVAGTPFGRTVAEATGAPLDRSGRVLVQADLSLRDHPEISVIGDLAAAFTDLPGFTVPKPVPGVSPAAKQMGRAAAANVLRRLRGEASVPFRYRDYGNLATVGRRAAVVDLTVPVFGALRFSGFLAWLFWLIAHIYFLIGYRNRLRVMFDWGWSYFTYERNARVVAEAVTVAERPTPANTAA